MLRFVLSTLALAAFLPLSAGAAPFQPFNIFDPTPRGVIVDVDGDGFGQAGLYRYAPNPSFVPDPNYPVFGYDVTDPSKYPFIQQDNNLGPTNMYEGTGLGEPFNLTPLTKVSGDEKMVGVGEQLLFGLDCNLAGVSANGGTPDCLFSDPNWFGTAAGGDPLVGLGVDGFGVAGINPGEPGVYTTDYLDVSVGQSSPSTTTAFLNNFAPDPRFTNVTTILALDPNDVPLALGGGWDPNANFGIPGGPSFLQRTDLRYSTASGGLLPGIGANGPQYGAAANPYRVPKYGPGSIFAARVPAAGAGQLAMLLHRDYQDHRVVPFPDPNFPNAAVAPILDPNPLSFTTPARWTSDGSIGKVTVSASQVTDFLFLTAIGGVLQASFDPNDAANLATHGCAFVDMGAAIPAAGCFKEDATDKIPILAGPDLIQPWSDWVIEIDLIGGQLDPNSTVGDIRATGTGTIWEPSANFVVPFNLWQQTFSGPWIDPNAPGFANYVPIPGVDGGINQSVLQGTGDTDFFCSTDGSISWGNALSLNSPTIGVVPVAGPTFDSSAASSGGGPGATSGGDTGVGSGGTPGVNGLAYTQQINQLSDAMLESPCHVLQTVPYDIATGVFRAIGPLLVGTVVAANETRHGRPARGAGARRGGAPRSRSCGSRGAAAPQGLKKEAQYRQTSIGS
jgi:hypothetical protein